MSGKTLSTGTLSLRFMQNAHRAKQLKEVQADKAEVKDDGEWEVGSDVKDAWADEPQSSQVVTYETSYLPFLFPSLPNSGLPSTLPLDDHLDKPKGRRVFKKGKEVLNEKHADSPKPTPKVADRVSGNLSNSARPISISGSSSASLHSLQKKPKSSTQTAKQAIYDNSGVGTDLRPRPPKQRPSGTSAPNVFLKPAGIDEPGNMLKPSTSKPLDSARDEDAPTSVIQDKAKRSRDSTTGQLDGEGKKRKKKRKGTE